MSYGFVPPPVEVAKDVYLIDLLESGNRHRTGAYVLLDELPTLIETGAAASHEALLSGLRQLGVAPADLAYVAVTHVHLDHAGGAGHLLALAPQAELLVHPRGARHMQDPSRLWAGAKAVYGDATERLFGEPIPIPEERIRVQEHESTLTIGSRTLTFLDSPGHASHHFTILDPAADALFAGDAVGLLYHRGFTGLPFDFLMPSSSPVDFDPIAVHRTMDMLKSRQFSTVLHTHFGPSPKKEAIESTKRLADLFADVIEHMYHPDITYTAVADALQERVRESLRKDGYGEVDLDCIRMDFEIDAMGLIHYQARKQRKARTAPPKESSPTPDT
jgi:glyoxylase-like metal-dependent hydrolase (beta-lactamase superfamily II)